MNAAVPDPLLTAALDYAAMGLHVFPVAPGGKLPAIPKDRGGNGHLDATTDAERIKAWWREYPTANIGLALAASGLVAVDVDSYKADCAWASFAQGLDLPATMTQRSARGGLHYVFQDGGKSYAGKLCAGVEIKHQGYILVEPSVAEGAAYRWETDDAPAPAPEWLPLSHPSRCHDGTAAGPQPLSHLSQCHIDLGERRTNVDRIAELLRGSEAHDNSRDLIASLVKQGVNGAAAREIAEGALRAGLEPGARLEERLARLDYHVTSALAKYGPAVSQPVSQPVTTGTAAELQRMVFPPVRWIVPGLIPEGLTLLAGVPKVGKSWLTLDIARAVAAGGETLGQDCEQGDVLLLALEDNARRLQTRLDAIAGEDDWPAALHYAIAWPRLDEGGEAAILQWLDAHPNARLVVVDTLACVKPADKGRGSAYDRDVGALRGLHQIASERGVSIVVVTHTRKAEAEDPIERVSGTLGLTGVADSTVVLARDPSGGGCVLYVRGRDVAEKERAVALEDCRWRVLGDPLEAFGSDTKKALIDAMRQGAQTPGKMVELTALDAATVRQTLHRMVRKGEAIKERRGVYALPRGAL